MEDTEQNKSEHATPFKLNKAREKGAVARGLDLGFLTALTAFVTYGWIAGRGFEDRIGLAARRAIVAAPNVLASPNEILAVSGALISTAMRPLALMALVIFTVVLLFELIQTGIVFSTQPLKPDFNRLNPAQNLKRLFSIRLLVETAKNVLKLAVYSGIAYLAIRHAASASFPTIVDARSLASSLTSGAFRLLFLLMVAAAAFAIFDQLIVRRDFSKKMRMSRRELRREVRDREGEPRMKQRRKQLHAEFSKLSQSLKNVRGADVLITNPTHFAVALKYDNRTMAAPTVVAHGTHQFALRLRHLAFQYGVVIIENRALARALYYKCPLNSEVPEILYQPIADIYLALRKSRNEHA